MNTTAHTTATPAGKTDRKCATNYQAMFEYLQANGATSSSGLRERFGAGVKVDTFGKRLRYMAHAGLLRNIGVPNREGLWEAMPEDLLAQKKATLLAQKKADAEAFKVRAPIAQEQCVYPRYCPPLAPPRQYDLMRAEPWRAPSPVAMRPGAEDHLQFQSRGHRC